MLDLSASGAAGDASNPGGRTSALDQPAVVARSIGSLRVHCRTCTGTEFSVRLASEHLAGDEGVVWVGDGRGLCRTCGDQLSARVGGWQIPLRATCMGCGAPLVKRQVKWCSKPGFGFNSICSVAWSNPSLLVRGLLELQDNLCGICCLPVDHWGTCEVDHVVALSTAGARTVDNLRSCHRSCNQAKKARTLAETRQRLGIGHDELLARTADAGPTAKRLLR